MVQERQQEIVNELLNYMDTLEDGSEVSTWDLMDEVFNYQRFNDGYCFNDFKISEEEFISLTGKRRKTIYYSCRGCEW